MEHDLLASKKLVVVAVVVHILETFQASKLMEQNFLNSVEVAKAAAFLRMEAAAGSLLPAPAAERWRPACSASPPPASPSPCSW